MGDPCHLLAHEHLVQILKLGERLVHVKTTEVDLINEAQGATLPNMEHQVTIQVLVNVKVKAKANNHPDAITLANSLANDLLLEKLFNHQKPSPSVSETEYFSERVGFLVQEEGDPHGVNNRWYGPDGETPVRRI